MYDTIKLFLQQNISVEEISKKFPQIKKSLLYKYLRIYNLEKFKSDPKNALYNSKEWLTLKALAMQRDGNKCTVCGTKGSFRNPLQLEHLRPKSLYPELMWDLNNVVIMCMRDHKKTLSWGKKGIKAYAKQNKETIEANKAKLAKSKKN